MFENIINFIQKIYQTKGFISLHESKFIGNETNSQNVMTHPIWILMYKLPIFENFQCGESINSKWSEESVVNIPSSVINS
jgi:hypothetical protein